MTDRPSIAVTVVIDASQEAVWSLVSDVTRVGEWGGECQGAEWVAGSGPAVDGRFLGRQRRGDHEWESMSFVTEFEPGSSFAWAVDDRDNPGATWRFDLSPEGSATRVVHAAVMGPGPSGLTAYIDRHPDREEAAIAARLEVHRRNMTATLAAIKAVAEGTD
jgi:uncharacterized protein YndB with AHSA1/START domain